MILSGRFSFKLSFIPGWNSHVNKDFFIPWWDFVSATCKCTIKWWSLINWTGNLGWVKSILIIKIKAALSENHFMYNVSQQERESIAIIEIYLKSTVSIKHIYSCCLTSSVFWVFFVSLDMLFLSVWANTYSESIKITLEKHAYTF